MSDNLRKIIIEELVMHTMHMVELLQDKDIAIIKKNNHYGIPLKILGEEKFINLRNYTNDKITLSILNDNLGFDNINLIDKNGKNIKPEEIEENLKKAFAKAFDINLEPGKEFQSPFNNDTFELMKYARKNSNNLDALMFNDLKFEILQNMQDAAKLFEEHFEVEKQAKRKGTNLENLTTNGTVIKTETVIGRIDNLHDLLNPDNGKAGQPYIPESIKKFLDNLSKKINN